MAEDPKITADTILDFLADKVSSKKVLSPGIWIDAAFKLNVLLGDEHEKLEDLRKIVSMRRLELMQGQDKRNVSAARAEVEASQDYKAMKIQEHKVDRIEEFIRLAKIQAKSAGGW